MTDLNVEGKREEAVATLFSVCRGLSKSARSISSAELADLDTTELIELRQAVTGARDGDFDWCTRTDKLIVAEFYRRVYMQAAIDAKAAVIIDEERRLASAAR